MSFRGFGGQIYYLVSIVSRCYAKLSSGSSFIVDRQLSIFSFNSPRKKREYKKCIFQNSGTMTVTKYIKLLNSSALKIVA